MYLKKIELTNFRQFGLENDNEPGLSVEFTPDLNILVGENDSGKTAVIDAIRYLLGSISNDYEKVQQEDFYCESSGLYSSFFYIEGTFVELSDKEAGAFLEWLSFNDEGEYELRVSLKVKKKTNDNGQEYIERKIQGGEKVFESRLNSHAREFLKTTYLKPLRDASNELKPGFRSRLAHILKAHPAFRKDDGTSHELVVTMQEANEKIEAFFEEEYTDGKSLVKDLENLLSDFHDTSDQSKSRSRFSVSKTDLSSILKRLSLETEDINLGLGNLNLLFIATELLLLKNGSDESVIGPRITLIEEIEAHLHTQSQIRLIKFLETELEESNNKSQYILTSHSSNLIASIDPRNIILLNDSVAYPFTTNYTELEDNDYAFIERFLDSTKSNLFFSKGIIFVEGDSEMLLVPALANLLGHPLHKNGVSLINVSGTAFERYIKLYSRSELWRKDRKPIHTPISIITDLDIKPWVYYEFEEKRKIMYSIKDEEIMEKVLEVCSQTNDDIISDNIGNEYSTFIQLAKDFKFKITEENKNEVEMLVETSISEGYIATKEEEKRDSIEQKYSRYDANIKVCVAPSWTLEYSIALSSLAPLLLESIQEVRYKKPYEGKKLEVFKELEEKLEKKPGDSAIAYEIFKPLNDKLISKAEVAQLFAVKINEIIKDSYKIEKIRESIEQDEKLRYLQNAIRHASTKSIAGGEK